MKLLFENWRHFWRYNSFTNLGKTRIEKEIGKMMLIIWKSGLIIYRTGIDDEIII